MRKTLPLFCVTLGALALSGCMHNDAKSLPPGQYEQSSKSIDSNGTAREQDSTTTVYYDKQGNKKAIVDKTESTDPEGLFNKNSIKTHEKIE